MNSQLRNHTLGALLRRTAQRYPEKPGIVYGSETWTYAEFNNICNRVAHGLEEYGVGHGDKVAVLAYNSNIFAVLRFAVARLGAVFVPINFMLNAREAAYNIRHSGARLLCVGSDFAQLGQEIVALETQVIQTVLLPGVSAAPLPAGWIAYDDLVTEDTSEPEVEINSSDLAQIIYTSGTESLPKGAMLSHDAILWQYVSCILAGEISTDDKILHALPLFHCAQLDVFLGPGVFVGATNIIAPSPAPDVILPAIETHGVNSLFCPPTVWISLLRSPRFDQTDLKTLSKGYYGAAIMPVEIIRELSNRLPGLRLWNFYGQTEIAPLATALLPEDQLRKPGSAGKPVLNVETRVVDGSMNDINPGEVGEIVHRSPQLFLGYYNDPERTEAAFEGGWFHSGDLATIDDEGYISIVDRKKDMIKTGGENVASREVEECIYLLPEVSEVSVIGVPHPYWVEAIVAVVIIKSSCTVSEESVIAHCRAELAHFKCPKKVLFTDTLPKNPSGKVLKRDLRSHYLDIMNEAE